MYIVSVVEALELFAQNKIKSWRSMLGFMVACKANEEGKTYRSVALAEYFNVKADAMALNSLNLARDVDGFGPMFKGGKPTARALDLYKKLKTLGLTPGLLIRLINIVSDKENNFVGNVMFFLIVLSVYDGHRSNFDSVKNLYRFYVNSFSWTSRNREGLFLREHDGNLMVRSDLHPRSGFMLTDRGKQIAKLIVSAVALGDKSMPPLKGVKLDVDHLHILKPTSGKRTRPKPLPNNRRSRKERQNVQRELATVH